MYIAQQAREKAHNDRGNNYQRPSTLDHFVLQKVAKTGYVLFKYAESRPARFCCQANDEPVIKCGKKRCTIK